MFTACVDSIKAYFTYHKMIVVIWNFPYPSPPLSSSYLIIQFILTFEYFDICCISHSIKNNIAMFALIMYECISLFIDVFFGQIDFFIHSHTINEQYNDASNDQSITSSSMISFRAHVVSLFTCNTTFNGHNDWPGIILNSLLVVILLHHYYDVSQIYPRSVQDYVFLSNNDHLSMFLLAILISLFSVTLVMNIMISPLSVTHILYHDFLFMPTWSYCSHAVLSLLASKTDTVTLYNSLLVYTVSIVAPLYNAVSHSIYIKILNYALILSECIYQQQCPRIDVFLWSN